MFKLDLAVFRMVYDYCKITGEAFGFGVLEGLFINSIAVVGAIIIGLNNNKRGDAK